MGGRSNIVEVINSLRCQLLMQEPVKLRSSGGHGTMKDRMVMKTEHTFTLENGGKYFIDLLHALCNASASPCDKLLSADDKELDESLSQAELAAHHRPIPT